MQELPDLEPLISNVVFDRTPEGLRIQIVDQEKRPMFPLGRADMFDETRSLLSLVAAAVSDLPNSLTITGHTDSLPFAGNGSSDYGNWDLSSDRAHATRRVLVMAGITDERIAEVSGVADRDPIFPEDTTHPMNRRISILLNYQTSPDGRDQEETADGMPSEDGRAGEVVGDPADGAAEGSPSDASSQVSESPADVLDRLIRKNGDIPDWVGVTIEDQP